ncbi:hypothetical protein FOL47_009429 [Perkinsus chesapeaki]|uniref:t-SNARE coiled-coil homology domain-containing protein n=1 Tax=Perkinsus chesapeaki TaxID=330153 RepID=A0A7J6L8A0_PERCH|nr:hypothetical protein FOL47_009429 [Perkinsus chesapeaki]
MVEVTSRFQDYLSDFGGPSASYLSPPAKPPAVSALDEQVSKAVCLIAEVKGNLAADRSAWRAGVAEGSQVKQQRANTREEADDAIDELGTLIKGREKAMRGSSTAAYYQSIKDILSGRLKVLDEEARQWQMYKHRVSSEREQSCICEIGFAESAQSQSCMKFTSLREFMSADLRILDYPTCAQIYSEAGTTSLVHSRTRAHSMFESQTGAIYAISYDVDPVALEKEAARLQGLRKRGQGDQRKSIDVLPAESFDEQGSSGSGDQQAADAGLEMESQMLLATYTNELDHARTTQQKVEELSHVVGVMGTKVDEQREQIGGIHSTARDSTAYVSSAGEQLIKARAHQSLPSTGECHLAIQRHKVVLKWAAQKTLCEYSPSMAQFCLVFPSNSSWLLIIENPAINKQNVRRMQRCIISGKPEPPKAAARLIQCIKDVLMKGDIIQCIDYVESTGMWVLIMLDGSIWIDFGLEDSHSGTAHQ